MKARFLLIGLFILALVVVAWFTSGDDSVRRGPDRPDHPDGPPPTFGEPIAPSFVPSTALERASGQAPATEAEKPGEKPDAVAAAVGLVMQQLGPLLAEANDPTAFLEATGSDPWKLHALPRPLVEKVLEGLASDDPAARLNAALVLSAIELTPEDLVTIRDAFDAELLAMKDRDSKNATLALAFALSTHSDRHGAAGLADAVRTGSNDDIDGFRRDAALVLGLAKDTESSSLLRDLLATDPDRAVRKNSAVGLGRIGGDENRTAIATALGRETDVEVRAWTALAAGRAAGPGGDDGTLADAMATDGEGPVRAAAAYALGRAGGEGTTAALIDSFYGEDHELGRVGIVAGLARREGTGERKSEFLANEGAAYLAEAVSSAGDGGARYYAALTMASMPRTDAGCEALRHTVTSDRSAWVRLRAVTSLVKLDGKAALPTLTKALEAEKSKYVRDEIERSIRRLSR